MQTVVVKPQYTLSLTLYDRGELNMIDFTHWNHVNMPSWVSKIGYNEFWERFSNAFLVLCITLPLPANISEKKHLYILIDLSRKELMNDLQQPILGVFNLTVRRTWLKL